MNGFKKRIFLVSWLALTLCSLTLGFFNYFKLRGLSQDLGCIDPRDIPFQQLKVLEDNNLLDANSVYKLKNIDQIRKTLVVADVKIKGPYCMIFVQYSIKTQIHHESYWAVNIKDKWYRHYSDYLNSDEIVDGVDESEWFLQVGVMSSEWRDKGDPFEF